jgi:hypothetical protein
VAYFAIINKSEFEKISVLFHSDEHPISKKPIDYEFK